MDALMADLAELYRIDNFIDTFALGHYARVMSAHDHRKGQEIAFKLLRPEHTSDGGDVRWEIRAFANEADLLLKLDADPHVVKLVDCGYVNALGEAPTRGEIVTFGRDVAGFTRALLSYAEQGWRPYLALEHLPRTHNLFYLMRPDRGGVRSRLPTEEGLALALQFAETLRMAHKMGIVYLDHKLEHVYWDGTHLRIIDFNSSRQLEGSLRENSRHLQTDIHNLCVGILYSLFTGLSPQKATLRPQPGTLSDVETRYQDVTMLDFGVEPTLSGALQDLLQRGAAMQIETVEQFTEELQQVATLHGWDFPGHYTSPASRDARAQIRTALFRLRQGEDAIREARDLLRDAAIQDGITDDVDGELRRLIKAVNDMLNGRVIP
jgi:serine/threonine protein kinase